MVNFGLIAAEIVSLVWGTPANFNGFRVLAALLHGTLVGLVGVSQTLRRCKEDATYIRQGGPHSSCPVVSFFFFHLLSFFPRLISAAADWMSTILLRMV